MSQPHTYQTARVFAAYSGEYTAFPWHDVPSI